MEGNTVRVISSGRPKTYIEIIMAMIISGRKRLVALFFCLGFLFSAYTPTVAVYAESRTPKIDYPTAQPNSSHINQPGSKAKMKGNYPLAQSPKLSTVPAAADAKPINAALATLQSGNSAKSGSLQQKAAALSGLTAKSKLASSEVKLGSRNENKGKGKAKAHELTDRRTATSAVVENANGTLTQKNYVTPHFYKNDGSWKTIDTSLTEDKNAGDATNAVSKAFGVAESWVSPTKNYTVTGNDWLARFSPSGSDKGMVRIQMGSDQVGFNPKDANKVSPVVTTGKDGKQTVHYYNLWDGVDVEYVVENAGLKENVILKNKNATPKVSFAILGAKLKKNTSTEQGAPAYVLDGALGDQFNIAAANLILNNFGFVSEPSVFSQSFTSDSINLSVKGDYLKNLPAKAFPAVIDPGVFRSTYGTRYGGGNYISFKDDGYVCPWNICNTYAGTLYDSSYNLRDWRSAFFAPYDQFRNSSTHLISASVHLEQLSGVSHWTGTSGSHNYQIGHATCLSSYSCDAYSGIDNTTFSSSGNIDATDIYTSLISSNDFGGWLMVSGDDSTYDSFKEFNPDNDYVDFTYGGTPSAPTMSTPVDNQVYVDPQASFAVNYETNPNGSTPLQYRISVSSGAGGYGTLVTSDWLNSTDWTIPDGILQDGMTYYVQAQSYDPITSTQSDWGPSATFRIDERTGSKDPTQTYDTFGPIKTDLATGNLSTSDSSHTSSALGGNLGITMDYNSPLKSRNGLVGEYYNFMDDYSTPVLTRVDQTVDYDWGSNSPGAPVYNTNFLVEWNGYFVAPTAGTYYFGMSSAASGEIEDAFVNGSYYSYFSCGSGNCYGGGITLTAGQVIPVNFEMMQTGSTPTSTAHLYVKGAVSEQIIPKDWLQTGVRPSNTNQGLLGNYYGKFDGTNTFSSGNMMLMQRTDPIVSFNWDTHSPMPGGPSGYLIRWSGYISVPVSGSYYLGADADDGTKIMLGTSPTTVLNDWTTHSRSTEYNSSYYLTANTPTKITVEHYNNGGSGDTGSFALMVSSTSSGGDPVPSSWLSPNANVLPTGWKLGLDPSGSVNYDHITVNQDSAVLSDSTGGTHEYKWDSTKQSYLPPLNEDGQLLRNADGTYTLQDVDGKTYVFNTDGSLGSVSTPTDDLHPVALQYEYASSSGGPAHLYKIKDGVDPTRNATLYYSGDSGCSSTPSGFDAAPPSGMICAITTNDGRTTNFYYTSGQLARINRPGDDDTDYIYQEITHSTDVAGYLLTGIRSSLANDAIAAGYQSDDDTATTQIGYDYLGRVSNVTQPAATSGATRMEDTLEYLPGTDGYMNSSGVYVDGAAGVTNEHVVGATEPNGFSRQIQYDNLLRTTEVTDSLNNSSVNSWDPQKDLLRSTTTADSEKTSYIYDDEDRLTDTWGPAPSSFFDSTTNAPYTGFYQSVIAHTNTSYDDSIVGPAVAWFDYTKQTGNSDGVLSGAPKIHKTGINTSIPGTLSDSFSSPPISASSGAQGIGLSATGKLRLPAGTYTFSSTTPDGVRLWVDDQLVINQWTDSSSLRTTTSSSFTISSTSPKRFRLDLYRKTGTTGTFSLSVQQSGGFSATTNWASYLSPDYSLKTSSTIYDATYGNETVTTNYGSTPELGQAQSAVIDPSGLALTSSSSYETQGATGSYMRVTSSTLPGGNSTSYSYYGATSTADDPCTTGTTEAYKEGGRIHTITEPDPDGAGSGTPITSTYVYDDAGRVVAMRKNTDSWTCTSYDTRGRVSETAIPHYSGAPGSGTRTLDYNYAVGGNPLIVEVNDDTAGAIDETVDLLGRLTQYNDANGSSTSYDYDDFGDVQNKVGDLGNEHFAYDDYHRLSHVVVDGNIYASNTYDSYGRLTHVQYSHAGAMALDMTYDTFGQLFDKIYTMGDGSTQVRYLADRSQSGKITNDQIQSGGTTLKTTYDYDSAGRLTSASDGTNSYAYNFGTQNSSVCGTGSGTDANSGKNSNRTSETINGVTNYYCYDKADKLTTSTDTNFGYTIYNSHGGLNVMSSGTGSGVTNATYYDSSDRIIEAYNYDSSGNGATTDYWNDPNGRVAARQTTTFTGYVTTSTNSYVYQYSSDSDGPDVVRDNYWNIVAKNFSLPGGVTLTINPQNSSPNDNQYSLTNTSNKTILTADADGTNTSTGSGPANTFVYDPFGNAITNLPGSTDQSSYGFAGQAMRQTESLLELTPIRMGARMYYPTIGRFGSTDSVPGGNANAYVYPADPINLSDFSGMSSACPILCVSSLNLQGGVGALQLQATVTASVIIHSVAATSTISTARSTAKSGTPATLAITAFSITVSTPSATPVFQAMPPVPTDKGSGLLGYFKSMGSTGGKGCVGSAGVFDGAVLLKNNFRYSKIGAPEAFFAANVGICIGGGLGSMLTYTITGEDYGQSLIDDARQGFEYP